MGAFAFHPRARAVLLAAAGWLGGAWAAQAAPFVPIEGQSDAHWRTFEQRIKDYQAGHGNHSLNVLQLGDSHTAGEYLAGRMRERFQTQFGNGGAGILPPGVIKDHPIFQARIQPSAQWTTVRGKDAVRAVRQTPSPGLGGFIGYGQEPYQTVIYEWPRQTDVSRLYVYSTGSAFKLYQGDTELTAARIRGNGGEAERAAFNLASDGNHRLTLLAKAGASDFQLFGITAVGKQAGAAYSNIGVNGATLDVLRNWDSEVTRAQIKDYAPALLILAFGTNDVVNPDFSTDKFGETLRRTGDWVHRNAPDAAVLLVMPPHAPGFGPRAMQNLDAARIQMRIASREYHWRVWDWSVLTEKNCVASCLTPDAEVFFRGDGIHLTKTGYEATADALFTALLNSGKHY